MTTSTSGTFRYPRIACPPGSVGSAQWHVVVEDYTSSSDDRIIGYNSATGSSIADDYTFGAVSGADLNKLNYNAAVSYDGSAARIWVGWTYSNANGLGPGAQGIYPLGLKCNSSGVVTGTTYWYVPNTINSSHVNDLLSLSGRYATDRLYITYARASNNVNDVFYKFIVPSSAGSFRIAEDIPSEPITELDIQSALNIDEMLTLNVIDMNGIVTYTETATAAIIGKTFQNLDAEVSSGIYLLQILSESGNMILTRKIFIGSK